MCDAQTDIWFMVMYHSVSMYQFARQTGSISYTAWLSPPAPWCASLFQPAHPFFPTWCDNKMAMLAITRLSGQHLPNTAKISHTLLLNSAKCPVNSLYWSLIRWNIFPIMMLLVNFDNLLLVASFFFPKRKAVQKLKSNVRSKKSHPFEFS